MPPRALAIVVALACWAGCGAKDACSDDTLSKALDAAAAVDASQRTELMAQGLLDACTSPEKPLPPSLRAALVAVREYETGSAFVVVARALRDDPSLWQKACAKGTAALNHLGWGPKASVELARACGTEQLTFASEGDFARAPTLGSLIAILAWPWLSTEGTDKVHAHRVAVALMGGDW